MPAEEEKKLIDEALKQGKLVIIRGRTEAKVRIEPRDKVLIVTRQ